jgi:hypothetical protein
MKKLATCFLTLQCFQRSTYLRQAQQLPQRTPSQRGQRHTVDVVNNILPQTADIVTKDTLPTDGS